MPFVELDALHWGPGWREPELEEYRERVRAVLSAPAWVVDGSYMERLASPEEAHLSVHRFESSAAAQRWLASLDG